MKSDTTFATKHERIVLFMIKAKASKACRIKDGSLTLFCLFRLFLFQEFFKLSLIFNIRSHFMTIFNSFIIFEKIQKINLFYFKAIDQRLRNQIRCIVSLDLMGRWLNFFIDLLLTVGNFLNFSIKLICSLIKILKQEDNFFRDGANLC